LITYIGTKYIYNYFFFNMFIERSNTCLFSSNDWLNVLISLLFHNYIAGVSKI